MVASRHALSGVCPLHALYCSGEGCQPKGESLDWPQAPQRLSIGRAWSEYAGIVLQREYIFLFGVSARALRYCLACQLCRAKCSFSSFYDRHLRAIAQRTRIDCYRRASDSAVACACRRKGSSNATLSRYSFEEGLERAPPGATYSSRQPNALSHAISQNRRHTASRDELQMRLCRPFVLFSMRCE